MQTENIVNNLIAAIESRNAEAVGNLLAEDVRFENVPEGNTIVGRKAAQEQFSGFFSKASSIHWDIERKIINNNVAVIERKNKIRFLDKNIVLPMITVLEIHDGKIKLFRDYFDMQSFLKQLEA